MHCLIVIQTLCTIFHSPSFLLMRARCLYPAYLNHQKVMIEQETISVIACLNKLPTWLLTRHISNLNHIPWHTLFQNKNIPQFLCNLSLTLSHLAVSQRFTRNSVQACCTLIPNLIRNHNNPFSRYFRGLCLQLKRLCLFRETGAKIVWEA